MNPALQRGKRFQLLLRFAGALLSITPLLILSSCDVLRNDRERDELGDYDIYVSSFSDEYLYMIDGRTLEPDRIWVGGAQREVVYDPLRNRLYGMANEKLFVVNTKTRKVIDHPLNKIGASPPSWYDIGISRDLQRLVVTISDSDENYRTIIADLDSGEILREEHFGKVVLEIVNPVSNIAYLSEIHSPALIAYDLEKLEIVRRYDLAHDGQPHLARVAAAHPDGRRLYITTIALAGEGGAEGSWLVELNLETGTLTPFYQLTYYRAKIQVSPDGRWLLQTQPGGSISIPSSPEIYAFDTNTRELRFKVSTSGTGDWELGPDAIDFSPDSRYAFVAPGADGWGTGPLLVIDLRKRRLADAMEVWDENRVIPIAVRVVPK